MATVLGLFLVMCAVGGVLPKSRRLQAGVTVIALLLLVGGVGSFLTVQFGPADLWTRHPWLPHLWYVAGFGVIGTAMGGALLLGVAARRLADRVAGRTSP